MKVRSQADNVEPWQVVNSRDLCASEDVACGAQIQASWLGLVVEKGRARIHPGLAAKAAGVACA